MNWLELDGRTERIIYRGRVIYLTTIKPQDTLKDRWDLDFDLGRRINNDKEFQAQCRRLK
jgi:hypothetical protein